MASISTSIQLYDKVSAPINNMISAMDNLCSAYESAEHSMKNGFNTSQIEASRQAINAASQQMVELGNHIEDNANHQQNFNNTVNQGTSAMDGLVGKAMKLATAYLSMKTVFKGIQLSDELTEITARLNLINDGIMTTAELQKDVFYAAQRSRGEFQATANMVAGLGMNARKTFGNNKELVAFTEQMNKAMVIAGADGQAAESVIYNMTQALSTGVLRGQDLNAVLSNAPNIIQNIADYMDVPMGQIRDIAQEGKITADIVKNAMLAAANETNEQFESMPMTWGQVWTSMSNIAIMKFQPVLDKINELANNEQFQLFANSAINALVLVADMLLNIMEIAGMVASFINENWSIIEPLIVGITVALGLYTAALLINNAVQGISATMAGIKAAADMMQAGATFTATAAQHGLNAALLACPLTWIIMLIIAVIAAIFAVCSAIAKMTGIANSGFGVITGGINVVIQFFKNLGLSVANIALGIGNALGALCSNMMSAFHNAISNVQSWFYNLLSTALSVIDGICAALNKLPFVKFDYSGITNAASEYAAKAANAAGNKKEYKSIGEEFSKGMSTFDTFQSGWASDAFKSGADWGDGVSNSIKGFFGGGSAGIADALNPGNFDFGNLEAGEVPGNIADTAKNTGKAADSLSISSEDLKYLHDIAEREVINRFTTAEIKVEMTNNNNINSDMDLDGVVDYLVTNVNEAMEVAARG